MKAIALARTANLGAPGRTPALALQWPKANER